MRLTPSLIPVSNIQASPSHASLEPKTVEEIANLILKTGALVDPLIVRRDGLESFVLLAGDGAFQAARRALELDPLKGEMVLALIADEKTESSLLRQSELLMPQQTGNTKSEPQQVGTRIIHVEQRIEQVFGDLSRLIIQGQEKVHQKLSGIQSQLPVQLKPLEELNRASPPDLYRYLLQAFTPKRSKALATAIVEAREESCFASLQDFEARVSGIGAKGVLKLLDCWSQVSFNRI